VANAVDRFVFVMCRKLRAGTDKNGAVAPKQGLRHRVHPIVLRRKGVWFRMMVSVVVVLLTSTTLFDNTRVFRLKARSEHVRPTQDLLV
jgi:hypothetical protein